MKCLKLVLLSAFFVPTFLAADEPSPIKVTTKRAEDKVEVEFEQNKALISIRCPSGIGSAVIERTGRAWPKQVIIKLHLRGLESLRITNGRSSLQASIPSGVTRPKLRLWKDDLEQSLDSKSPFWMDVRMISGNAISAERTPLTDGHLLMRIPKIFFDTLDEHSGTPSAITLNWIDFYR